MEYVNPKIVMTQVKKNLVYELTDKSETSPRHKSELIQLLMKEDLNLDEDTINRLLNHEPKMGLFKKERQIIKLSYPKPELEKYSGHDIKIFSKRLIKYSFLKFFEKFLAKTLPHLIQNETSFQTIGIIEIDKENPKA